MKLTILSLVVLAAVAATVGYEISEARWSLRCVIQNVHARSMTVDTLSVDGCLIRNNSFGVLRRAGE
jgi:hypothetical protein